MAHINSLRCAGSIQDGILTLEDGRTINLAMVQNTLALVCNSLPTFSVDDDDNDPLVIAQAQATLALAEFTNACA